MLAGNRRIGTAARHAEFAPGRREKTDAQTLGDGGDLRVQLPIQKFRHQRRTLGDRIDQPFHILFSDSRELNLHLVGIVGGARHQRLDGERIGMELHALNHSPAVVASSSRKAITEVDVGKRRQPGLSPPGGAEFDSFRHCRLLLIVRLQFSNRVPPSNRLRFVLRRMHRNFFASAIDFFKNLCRIRLLSCGSSSVGRAQPCQG